MAGVILDHIALDVADLDASAAFYCGLLGAEVVAHDSAHRLTFLRLPGSARYADIALHVHASVDAAYPPDQVRSAHIGWAVSAATDLVHAFDFFTERTRVTLVADFGFARSVMGTDPDGHVVEIQLPRAGAVDRERRFDPLDIDMLRQETSGARQGAPARGT